MRLSTLLIRAIQRHADRIVNAAKLIVRLCAPVCQIILEHLQAVGQNVFQVQSVHPIGHVLIKNVKIRARAHVERMLNVVLIITARYAHAKMALSEIRSQDAIPVSLLYSPIA